MKLPKDAKKMLDALGVSWKIENGGKHQRVIVAEKLVAVLPFGKRREEKEWIFLKRLKAAIKQ